MSHIDFFIKALVDMDAGSVEVKSDRLWKVNFT